MFAHRQPDPFILSSSCPYSCSLVAFALRIGGILDPEFLVQCQVEDKKLQKIIDELKQIPLTYNSSSSNFDYQEELYLDMDAKNKKQFTDSWEFKQYNSWLSSEYHQWNTFYSFNDDIIIDLI